MLRKILMGLGIGMVAALATTAHPGESQAAQANTAGKGELPRPVALALERIDRDSLSPAIIAANAGNRRTGSVICDIPAAPWVAPDAGRVASWAVEQYRDYFGDIDTSELGPAIVTGATLGVNHVFFQQLAAGLPVDRAYAEVAIREEDEAFSVIGLNNLLVPGIDLSWHTANYTLAEAIALVEDSLPEVGELSLVKHAVRVVFRDGDEPLPLRARVAYLIDAACDLGFYRFWVDQDNGELLYSGSLKQEVAWDRVTRVWDGRKLSVSGDIGHCVLNKDTDCVSDPGNDVYCEPNADWLDCIRRNSGTTDPMYELDLSPEPPNRVPSYPLQDYNENWFLFDYLRAATRDVPEVLYNYFCEDPTTCVDPHFPFVVNLFWESGSITGSYHDTGFIFLGPGYSTPKVVGHELTHWVLWDKDPSYEAKDPSGIPNPFIRTVSQKVHEATADIGGLVLSKRHCATSAPVSGLSEYCDDANDGQIGVDVPYPEVFADHGFDTATLESDAFDIFGKKLQIDPHRRYDLELADQALFCGIDELEPAGRTILLFHLNLVPTTMPRSEDTDPPEAIDLQVCYEKIEDDWVLRTDTYTTCEAFIAGIDPGYEVPSLNCAYEEHSAGQPIAKVGYTLGRTDVSSSTVNGTTIHSLAGAGGIGNFHEQLFSRVVRDLVDPQNLTPPAAIDLYSAPGADRHIPSETDMRYASVCDRWYESCLALAPSEGVTDQDCAEVTRAFVAIELCDYDDDGVYNGDDNCPYVQNQGQEDGDTKNRIHISPNGTKSVVSVSDAYGDACDACSTVFGTWKNGCPEFTAVFEPPIITVPANQLPWYPPYWDRRPSGPLPPELRVFATADGLYVYRPESMNLWTRTSTLFAGTRIGEMEIANGRLFVTAANHFAVVDIDENGIAATTFAGDFESAPRVLEMNGDTLFTNFGDVLVEMDISDPDNPGTFATINLGSDVVDASIWDEQVLVATESFIGIAQVGATALTASYALNGAVQVDWMHGQPVAMTASGIHFLAFDGQQIALQRTVSIATAGYEMTIDGGEIVLEDQGTVGCVFRVDAESTAGQPDGATWATAYRSIQAGIDAAYAAATDEEPCEVWVAGGAYYVYATSADDTLRLRSDVSVFGGFGGDEERRDERDTAAHPTVIDGRFGPTSAYRVAHVVTGSDEAVLDGFTIQGGRAASAQEILFVANGNYTQEQKIESHLNASGRYHVTKKKDYQIKGTTDLAPYDLVIITEFAPNISSSGLANIEASGKPVLIVEYWDFWYSYRLGLVADEDCGYVGTRTVKVADTSHPITAGLSSPVTVYTASYTVYGIDGYDVEPWVTPIVWSSQSYGEYAVIVDDDRRIAATGIYDTRKYTAAAWSLFDRMLDYIGGPDTGRNGGGMLNTTASPTIRHCVFAGNEAAGVGGAMYNESASPTVFDCSFDGNTASNGGAVYNASGSAPTLLEDTFSGNIPNDVAP